jgi:stearoyl-CoA desaturase (delta-9 desaturase)
VRLNGKKILAGFIMKTIFVLLICHWYLSLFCQTFYLHRYGAHAMFKMNYFWDRFFFVLTFLCQGSSFLNPKAYSILHQTHHHYSDTELDPHSPHFNKNAMQMMINTWKSFEYWRIDENNDVPPFVVKCYPRWRFFEFLSGQWAMNIFWGALYVSIYHLIDPPWPMYFLLPFHFLMGPIQGAIVNWFGHMLGHRNFELNDKSRNTLWVDLFLMGELYQNNHHRFPKRPNFASKWFELDVCYTIMRALYGLRIIN